MKSKKILILMALAFLSIPAISCSSLPLGSSLSPVEEEIYEIYNLAKENGYTKDFDTWLNEIKGDEGLSVTSITILEDDKDGNIKFQVNYSDGTNKEFTLLKGNKGDTGDPGLNGKTLITGEGSPSKDLGSVGDIYIDSSTFDVFQKKNQGWLKIGNIKGEQGETGGHGETGSNGNDGTTIITGVSAPLGSVGKLNDIYLDTNTFDIYIKTINGWIKTGNIKGMTGESGQDGQPGTDGRDIISGSGNPNNELGKIGDVYLNKESFDIYEKTNKGWCLIGNLKGQKGDKGEDGNAVLSGNGAPSNDIGKEQDLYLDLDTFTLYVKNNNIWIKEGSIIGSNGQDGNKGDQGEQGIPGQDGNPGKPGISAYEKYKEQYQYVGSEVDWLKDLALHRLGTSPSYNICLKIIAKKDIANIATGINLKKLTIKNGESIYPYISELNLNHEFYERYYSKLTKIDPADYRAYEDVEILYVYNESCDNTAIEKLGKASNAMQNLNSYTTKIEYTFEEDPWSNMAYDVFYDGTTIYKDKFGSNGLIGSGGQRQINSSQYYTYNIDLGEIVFSRLVYGSVTDLMPSYVFDMTSFKTVSSNEYITNNTNNYIVNSLLHLTLNFKEANYTDWLKITLDNNDFIASVETIATMEHNKKVRIKATTTNFNKTKINHDFSEIDSNIGARWEDYPNISTQLKQYKVDTIIPCIRPENRFADNLSCEVKDGLTYLSIHTEALSSSKANDEFQMHYEKCLIMSGFSPTDEINIKPYTKWFKKGEYYVGIRDFSRHIDFPLPHETYYDDTTEIIIHSANFAIK